MEAMPENKIRSTYKSNLPFELVFIGGAPRSGTSLLHALVCTDKNTNDYIAECSYFRLLLESFFSSYYDETTTELFNSKDDFISYNAELLTGVLMDFWETLGKPKRLALKDPLISAFFIQLATFFPRAKFLLSLRNPLQIIASQKKVDATSNERDISEVRYSVEALKWLAENTKASYLALSQINANRLMLVAYENLDLDQERSRIQSFLNIDMNLRELWGSYESRLDKKNYWHTDKYYKPLSINKKATYKDILTTDEIQVIETHCRSLINLSNELIGVEYGNYSRL